MTATTFTRPAPSPPQPVRLPHQPRHANAEARSFVYPQGLRRLLLTIHRTEDGWRVHPDVPDLFRYCQAKYELLARRYGQTAADAASAAFDVMAVPSLLDADDPWGVVTKAVQRTLQAEDRANRLLTSTDHARRLMHSGDHDTVRFADYGTDRPVPLAIEHLAADPAAPEIGAETEATLAPSDTTLTAHDARRGLVTVRSVLMFAGWPPDVARVGLEYLCERLRLAGNPQTAFEYLRRDVQAIHLLGIGHRTWVRLCRALLGDPGRPGLLARAILGERPLDLARDRELMRELAPVDTMPHVVLARGVRHA